MESFIGEISQIGGLLFGGVVIAASCALSQKKGDLNEANPLTAIETYRNDICRDFDGSSICEKIMLGPPLNDEYNKLLRYFRKSGFNCVKDKWYMTVDLLPLLAKAADFSTERKLYNELVNLGLILVPGEIFGAVKPGQFRISFSIIPTDELLEEIIARFEKLFYESGKERATTLLKLKLSKKAIITESPVPSSKRRREE